MVGLALQACHACMKSRQSGRQRSTLPQCTTPLDLATAWQRTYEAMGELQHVANNLELEQQVELTAVSRMPLKTKPPKDRPKGPKNRARPPGERGSGKTTYCEPAWRLRR